MRRGRTGPTYTGSRDAEPHRRSPTLFACNCSYAHRSTSRSGSSTWRPWPANGRWSPARWVASPRWSWTARPGRWCRLDLRQDDPMTPVDPGRFESDLAAAVNRLMADASLRETMGRAGRARAWNASAGRRSRIRPWTSTGPSCPDRLASASHGTADPERRCPRQQGHAASRQRAVLVARDLRKTYGTLQAVDGVSFEVASGEVFGIRDRTARARPPPSR